MSHWVKGQLVAHKQWTESLFSLYVHAPIDPYIAGQFTQVGVQIEEQVLFRPYSFVNAPEDPLLEFYYRYVPSGELTKKLRELKPNEVVYLSRRASGRFTLAHVPEGSDIWLMATGTGLGVFLALLRTTTIWARFATVILVHSVRRHNELSHLEIINSLGLQWGERFRYIPIVTQEKVATILHDRLPSLIESGQLEKNAHTNITSASRIMLCGNPDMIKDVSVILTQQYSCAKAHLIVERYWKQ